MCIIQMTSIHEIYDLAEVRLKLISEFGNDIITFWNQIYNLGLCLNIFNNLISLKFKEKKKVYPHKKHHWWLESYSNIKNKGSYINTCSIRSGLDPQLQ